MSRFNVNFDYTLCTDTVVVNLSQEQQEIADKEFEAILARDANNDCEINETLHPDICDYISIKCTETNLKSYAKKYTIIASKGGNLNALCRRTNSHASKNFANLTNKNEYQTLLSINTPEILNFIGALHFEYDSAIDAKKFYLLAIEQGNVCAMINLGIYYQIVCINHVLMKKYYEMAESNPNITQKHLGYLYYCFGYYYLESNVDYEKMFHYFKLSAVKGNVDSMVELGMIYNEKNGENVRLAKYNEQSLANQELSTKYFTDAIKLDGEFIPHIKEQFNAIEFYQLLCNIESPNEEILKEIDKLSKDANISKILYKIKISTEHNLIRECPICMETKLNIFNNCGHLSCVDCYDKVDNCPFCKEPKINYNKTPIYWSDTESSNSTSSPTNMSIDDSD